MSWVSLPVHFACNVLEALQSSRWGEYRRGNDKLHVILLKIQRNVRIRVYLQEKHIGSLTLNTRLLPLVCKLKTCFDLREDCKLMFRHKDGLLFIDVMDLKF